MSLLENYGQNHGAKCIYLVLSRLCNLNNNNDIGNDDDSDNISGVIFSSLGETRRSLRTSYFDALGPGWNGYFLHLHDHYICPGILFKAF